MWSLKEVIAGVFLAVAGLVATVIAIGVRAM